MTKIAFIDRDGTVMRERPVSPLMFFHAGARALSYGAARSYLSRMAKLGVRFVWNSRNPDDLEPRPKGRLHNMNTRHFDGGAAEHVELLRACGIEQEWLFPGYPEVIHRHEWSKGQAMGAWLKARGIAPENSVAFDNNKDEMTGYPPARVVTVNPDTGIMRADYIQALALLGIEDVTASLKTGERPASPTL